MHRPARRLPRGTATASQTATAQARFERRDTVRSPPAVTSTSSFCEESNPISVRLTSFITIMSRLLRSSLARARSHSPGAVFGGEADQDLSGRCAWTPAP